MIGYISYSSEITHYLQILTFVTVFKYLLILLSRHPPVMILSHRTAYLPLNTSERTSVKIVLCSTLHGSWSTDISVTVQLLYQAVIVCFISIHSSCLSLLLGRLQQHHARNLTVAPLHSVFGYTSLIQLTAHFFIM